MIISLIDFTFVRSLAADAYSIFGPSCYDPVTLFLLDMFRHVDDHPDMNAFLTVLRDEKRGSEYRQYGALYPTWARYKGCTPAFAGAGSISVSNVPG